MNFYSESRSSARFSSSSMMIAAILVCASFTAVVGQGRSEDRDNPAPINSNKINDALDGSNGQYFYKFTAGPGKLTVTFEVTASGTNAGAMLDLFVNSRPILSDVLAQGVDGGTERQVNSVQLNGKREIVVRVKGMKYGDSGGTGAYTITLDGPIAMAPGAATTPANAPDPAPAAAAAPADPAPAAASASNLISGPLDPADEKVIFHRLKITGSGAVTFNFSVKAKDKNAGARFGLLGENGQTMWVPSEIQDGGSILRSLSFPNDRSITIVVQAIKFPDNAGRGTYSVQLSGPVTVADQAAAPPANGAPGPNDSAAPAPAGPNVVSGQLNPEVDRKQIFHQWSVAAPGVVTFNFSVKATDKNAGATFVVLDQRGVPVLSPFQLQSVGANPESVSKAITFATAQTITVLLQSIAYGANNGAGTYTVQVIGAVSPVKR